MATKKKVSRRNKKPAKVREIQQIVTDISGGDAAALVKSYNLFSRSHTAHSVAHLEEVVNNSNYQLSNWEVEQINDFYKKFAAKYNSPLAKALK